MRKTVRTMLFSTLVMAVLCAGTLSARQLSLVAQDTTCQHHFCSKKLACPNVLGCGCVLQPGFDSGVCGFIAARPQPAVR